MLLRVERGKGGRYRNAMLSEDLLTLLREWWKVGRQQGVMHRDGWLFPGQHAMKPISTRQLYRIVVEATKAAAIAKRVGPHTLRHSFATHLWETGTDIRIIPVLIGHAKLNNTALYIKVATKTVRTVTRLLDAVLHTWGSATTHHPHDQLRFGHLGRLGSRARHSVVVRPTVVAWCENNLNHGIARASHILVMKARKRCALRNH